MNNTKLSFWIRILRLVVGSVALIQAAVFLFALYGKEHALRQNPLFWIQSVLAGCEIVAALLFLVPRTFVFGAWALLAVFLFATLLHVAHGEFGVIGGLLVYAVAVLVVKADRNSPMPSDNSGATEESK